MKVILLKDVSGVGQKGAIKEVSDGYALNQLIPKKLAQAATKEAIAAHEKRQADEKKLQAERDVLFRGLSKQLDGKSITLLANASAQGHLYEKIAPQQLVVAIKKELNLEVPAEAIHAKMAIKQVGSWPVEIVLGSFKATITVQVKQS